jgi:hypothetical protein
MKFPNRPLHIQSRLDLQANPKDEEKPAGIRHGYNVLTQGKEFLYLIQRACLSGQLVTGKPIVRLSPCSNIRSKHGPLASNARRFSAIP